MKTLVFSLLMGLPFFSLTPVSQATTLRAQRLDQLSARADCVVLGRIEQRWSERRGALLYTVNRVVVEELLRQNDSGADLGLHPGAVLQVAQLGGRLGDWQMPVAGTAPLQVGDRQVLFLRRDPDREAAYYIAGMSQGALKLLGDDRLLWAPTAPLYRDGQILKPRARWLRLSALRAA